MAILNQLLVSDWDKITFTSAAFSYFFSASPKEYSADPTSGNEKGMATTIILFIIIQWLLFINYIYSRMTVLWVKEIS